MLDLRVGVPNMLLSLLTPWGKVLYFLNPSQLWVTARGVESHVKPCLCLSCLSPYFSCIFSCQDAVHLVLRSFRKENYSLCSCKYVVLRGGGKFMVLLWGSV